MKEVFWDNAYSYAIGINKYQHLNTLSFCENDAKKFDKNIKDIIPNVKTMLIEGHDFTQCKFTNILTDISNINNNENENNLLITNLKNR